MGKLELIASTKAEIISGQDSLLDGALTKCYEGGFVDGGSGTPSGFTQADIDHAVSLALETAKLDSDAALSNALSNAKIVSDQALVDMQTKCDQTLADDQIADDKVMSDLNLAHEASLAAVNQALVDMTAKEQLEELAVADIKLKIDQVQESFDKIKAILFPSPIIDPPVVPVDPPTDPVTP